MLSEEKEQKLINNTVITRHNQLFPLISRRGDLVSVSAMITIFLIKFDYVTI